jgi:hypothetical protein
VKESPDAEATADTAWLLYDTALLQSGFQQDDVDAFASRMYRTMKGALKLDSLELEEEIEVRERRVGGGRERGKVELFGSGVITEGLLFGLGCVGPGPLTAIRSPSFDLPVVPSAKNHSCAP